jgi:hypothetical protein
VNKALQFLALVQRAVDERGRLFDEYLPIAVKASLKIPDDVSAEQASVEFIRLLYGEPIGNPDTDGGSEVSNG